VLALYVPLRTGKKAGIVKPVCDDCGLRPYTKSPSEGFAMSIHIECSQCGKCYNAKDRYAGQRVRCKVCGEGIDVPNLAGNGAGPIERSRSGSPIYRHTARKQALEPAAGDSEVIEAIGHHIRTHIGEVSHVFHELVSNLVHVDLHCIPSSDDRPYHTLVTSGMSERPMTVPAGAEDFRFAELMLCLPASWPLEQEAFADEANYWPLRWLKMLARFPHEFGTWLAYGHTVPNGDPATPFASNTELCCALLTLPLLVPEDFLELPIRRKKTVQFYSLVPLYREEMEFKLAHGMDALGERLVEHNVTELLDVERSNVAIEDR
jgi:hypothetical protein